MGFDLSELLGVFLDEAGEQLQMLEACILELEEQGQTPELIQRMFRTAHTMKGSSAAMGYEAMKSLTHEMENVLDAIRNGRMTAGATVVEVLFQCLDALRTMKELIEQGQPDQLNIAQLAVRLRQLPADGGRGLMSVLENGGKEVEAAELSEEEKLRLRQAAGEGVPVWRIRITLSAACEMKAVRAYVIYEQLSPHGDIIAAFPRLREGMDDEECGRLHIYLASRAEEPFLRALLLGMYDVTEAVFAQEQPGAMEAEPADAGEAAQTDEQRMGKTLKKGQPEEAKRSGHTIRVDVDRLEKLMNLVGELVIDQTRIAQIGGVLQDRYGTDQDVDEMQSISNHFSQVIGELQETVMKARMLPIEQLFSRFPRMIRDLTQSLSKEVSLIIEGQETELDRTVIEEIGDPLIHLVRNAVDHGIEPADIRMKAGKPPKGTVAISASHQDNHVVVSIADDGAGMRPEAIKQSALRKQLITEQEAEGMSENELIHLIFRPGFSTAAAVSDVSGRGVGMDIVRSQVEKLSGLIDIETKAGEGTTFTIKLPLTLAILTGLLVRLNGRTFVAPMSAVVEIVRLQARELTSVKGEPVVVIRDKVLPIVWLHDEFQIARSEKTAKHVFIVIVGVAEKRLGIVVDELVGNQEIVVKSLGAYIGKIPGISGATILGDGSVAPILDVSGVIRLIDARKTGAAPIGVQHARKSS